MKSRRFICSAVGRELLQYDSLAVNTIVKNKNGEVSSCDVPFSTYLMQFNTDYLRLTREVAESCANHEQDKIMIDFENIFIPYKARKLAESDITNILELYLGNPEYFQHCPPSPSRETIQADMSALPPGKKANEKYFIGLFARDSLVAVMDLIDHYPDDQTAYIGLLMVSRDWQGRGIGTFLVKALSEALTAKHYKRIRLGCMKTNLSAQEFWFDQGFRKTGVESSRENSAVIEAEKTLQP